MRLQFLAILLALPLVCSAQQITATLSPTSLNFSMIAGRFVESQRVLVTFSINYQNDSKFRIQRPPDWLQVLHGLGPAATDWILTQPYYLDVRPRETLLLGAGEYRTRIVMELSNGRTYDVSVTVVVTAPPVPPPAPRIGAVTNAGYFSLAGFAPGSLVTIYGERLSATVAVAGSQPLPRILAGTEVHFCRQSSFNRDCQPLELLYVSPTQINFALRFTYIDGLRAGFAVRSFGVWDVAAQTAPGFTAVGLGWIAPGIFAAGYDCPIDRPGVPCGMVAARSHADQVLRATITDASYRLISAGNPAAPGGVYVAWLTGLGNDGRVDDLRGQLGGLRMRIALQRSEVSLASIADAELLYAGAVRGFVGLYQLNFRIPSAVARPAGICAGAPKEIWLQLFGATVSPDIAFPLRAAANEPACN